MNKWIYFLPQFAMLFPCCSKNPLCPWTRILSRAVSSAWNSASDSSTFQEPRFSRILPWFLDPGSGLHLDIYAASSSMRSGLWLQLFLCVFLKQCKHRLVCFDIFFAKLWNEFADIVAVGKIRIYSHFSGKKTTCCWGERNKLYVVFHAVWNYRLFCASLYHGINILDRGKWGFFISSVDHININLG